MPENRDNGHANISASSRLREALTGITLDHLPRDGALGRVRRLAKGAYLWHADDAADRVYFLRKGRVAIMTAKPHERPVALRTIEPDQPFGELCVCSTRTGMRETTACALLACEVFEVKMSRFLGYLRQNRAALEAMMFTLCLRLTDAEHRIEVMAHRGAEQRLGRLLLRLATSRGRKGNVGLRDTVTGVGESQRAGRIRRYEPPTRHGHDGAALSSRARVV
jgi:CRP-like cAMP-binding protein